MNVWRLTIKPDAEQGTDPRQFCIQKNILGFGGPVSTNGPVTWAEYEQKANEKYCINKEWGGWRAAANAIYHEMKIGDLCWTRDTNGNYYMGRVEGPWEYCASEDHLSADIVSVRPCRWIEIGTVDAVPGKILNSFRAPRTLQAIYGDTVQNFSKLMYNMKSDLSTNFKYELEYDNLDIFSLIFPEDCEDLVAIYLQEFHGYRLLPSTCKTDTSHTEFVLRKRGKKAQVQVKQGETDTLNRDNYLYHSKDPSEWFLFSTCGKYEGKKEDHIHCLEPSDMKKFIFSNTEMMSSRVKIS